MHFLRALSLFVLAPFCIAGELDEKNGVSECYHQPMHNAEEAYLVHYVSVVNNPSINMGNYHTTSTLEIVAVIEHVFKGAKEAGHLINFIRSYDSKVIENASERQQRFIIFLERVDDEFLVNAQDPAAIFPFTEEIYRFLNEHK
jgi:hypothetical protein